LMMCFQRIVSSPMSGRLTPALVAHDCALGVPGHGPRARRLLLSVVPCAPLPCPSVPSASPPDSERVPKLDRASGGEVGRAQGEAGGERVPARSPAADVGAMPTWHRNRLGVGRVARRARLVIKPFSRPLPRLILKAGHKEGLPTNPTTACGAMSPSVRAVPCLNEMHPNTEYY
jgi:hypothetical protein